MFHAHPHTAARLLSKIPRLEVVTEIIRGQHSPQAESFGAEQSRQGAYMLHLALELDRRIYCGAAYSAALAELRLSRRFDSRMLDALQGYSPTKAAEFEVRRIPIRALRAGMVLDTDVFSKDGNVLILKGSTMLTDIWIERLQNFANVRGAQELVDVRIPKLAGVGQAGEVRRP
jgi:hypothetical protein